MENKGKDNSKKEVLKLVKVNTNKDKKAYIQNDEYYFTFEKELKDNILLYRYKKYKKISKRLAFLKFKNNEISEKNVKHNHYGNKKVKKIVINISLKLI
jgi:hypothetical protein